MAKTKSSVKDFGDLPDDLHDESLEQESVASVVESSKVNELHKIEEILASEDVSGGTIKLERKGQNDLKWQLIGKFKVEDFNPEHIKAVYGGGDYRVQMWKAEGGSAYKKFEFSIDYRLKGAMDKPAGEAIQNSRDPALAMQLAHSSESTKLLMEVMQQSSDRQTNSMMMMMQMSQESSKQNLAMMSGMFTALSAALSNRPAPVDSNSAMMPVILEMVRSKSGGSLTEMIAAVKDLRELTTGDKPEQEKKDEDMMDKVFKYGGPLLTAILTKTPLQMPGSGQPQPQPQSQVHKVIELPVSQEPVSQPVDEKPDVVKKLNMYLGVLISAAEREADPTAYAQVISDMLTDDHFDKLIVELNKPEWFASLSDGNAAVSRHKEWFEQLREAIFEMYEPASTSPEQNDDGTGDSGSGPAAKAN